VTQAWQSVRRAGVVLGLCAAVGACGSNAQYERNQRAIDDQIALGESADVNADIPNMSDQAPAAR